MKPIGGGAWTPGQADATRSGRGWLVPDWPAPAHVRACVTTRSMPGASLSPFDTFNLGAHCGDDPGAVAKNRAALVPALALPSAPRWLRQVHGTDVAVFGGAAFDDAEDSHAETVSADAALARSANVVLCVLTADCLPLLLAADDGSEIAVIHAGWRGLAAGVIERCIVRMRTPRDRLLVWLGPAIGPKSYEVGEEVRAAFVAHESNAVSAFTATRPGHWHCDLYTLARQRLHACEVRRIFGGDHDTLVDPRFYSYRRDGETGRFASLIWIE